MQLRAQEQARYEAEKQKERQAQLQPQKSESLDQSRMAFANADSDLNTVWSKLTPAKKKELLPSQRQWIKTKDAMCGKVSMQGTDAEVKKMVDCQTQMTLSRIAFLRNQ